MITFRRDPRRQEIFIQITYVFTCSASFVRWNLDFFLFSYIFSSFGSDCKRMEKKQTKYRERGVHACILYCIVLYLSASIRSLYTGREIVWVQEECVISISFRREINAFGELRETSLCGCNLIKFDVSLYTYICMYIRRSFTVSVCYRCQLK